MTTSAAEVEIIQISRDCISVNDILVIRSIDGREWLPEGHLTAWEWQALNKFLRKRR